MDFVDFSYRLGTTKNPHEQSSVLLEALNGFGYQQFILGTIPAAVGLKESSLISLDNIVPEWRKEYDDEQFEKHDIAVRHCIDSTEPLLWSQILVEENLERFEPEFQHVGERARFYGYKVGVTIPLRLSWSPFKFGMSLIEYPAGPDHLLEQRLAEHDMRFKQHERELRLISQLFLAQAEFSHAVVRRYNLSPEEIDIMSRVLEGTTYDQIAEDVGYDGKAHKVKYRLRKIAEKLGVDTIERAMSMFISLCLSDRTYSGYTDGNPAYKSTE